MNKKIISQILSFIVICLLGLNIFSDVGTEFVEDVSGGKHLSEVFTSEGPHQYKIQATVSGGWQFVPPTELDAPNGWSLNAQTATYNNSDGKSSLADIFSARIHGRVTKPGPKPGIPPTWSLTGTSGKGDYEITPYVLTVCQGEAEYFTSKKNGVPVDSYWEVTPLAGGGGPAGPFPDGPTLNIGGIPAGAYDVKGTEAGGTETDYAVLYVIAVDKVEAGEKYTGQTLFLANDYLDLPASRPEISQLVSATLVPDNASIQDDMGWTVNSEKATITPEDELEAKFKTKDHGSYGISFGCEHTSKAMTIAVEGVNLKGSISDTEEESKPYNIFLNEDFEQELTKSTEDGHTECFEIDNYDDSFENDNMQELGKIGFSAETYGDDDATVTFSATGIKLYNENAILKMGTEYKISEIVNLKVEGVDKGTTTLQAKIKTQDGYTAVDKLLIKVVPLDIDHVSITPTPDETHELCDKKLIVKWNFDDDNQNGTPDHDESGKVKDEDDLFEIVINKPNIEDDNSIKISYSSELRLFEEKDKSKKAKDSYLVGDLPKTLWVEGYAKSTSVLGAWVKIETTLPDGGTYAEDKIAFTVTGVDLDVDSDNNNLHEYPDCSDAEEKVEFGKDPQKPIGKIFSVNNEYFDGDMVPGFADGFAAFSEPEYASIDKEAEKVPIIPMALEISPLPKPEDFYFVFNYALSDPKNVEREQVDETADGKPIYDFTAPKGIRVWWSDQSSSSGYTPQDRLNIIKSRKKTSILSGGNLVPVGEKIYPENLNLDSEHLKTTFYVEAIPGSEEVENVTVKVSTYSRQNDTLLSEDEVRLRPAYINIDIARLDKEEVHQSIEQKNGSITKFLHPKFESTSTAKEKWRLEIPNFEIKPQSILPLLKFELAKEPPSHSVGKFQIYQSNGVYLDKDTSSKEVKSSEIGRIYSVEAIEGGVIKLVLSGTINSKKILKDEIRVSAIACPPKEGNIIFVNKDADSHEAPFDDFDKNASQTIEKALKIAEDQDNVVVGQGTYLESELSIPNEIVLAGLAGKWQGNTEEKWKDFVEYVLDFSQLPKIDASEEAAVIHIESDDVTVSGLHILNGLSSEDGGGIKIVNKGGIELIANKFESCKADSDQNLKGGAIAWTCDSDSGDLIIGDCLFEINEASEGGAVYGKSKRNIEIKRSMFFANIASHSQNDLVRGGAIFLQDFEGTINIEDSFLCSNRTEDLRPGGDNGLIAGLVMTPVDLAMARSIIDAISYTYTMTKEDIGAFGGAICVWEGNPTVKSKNNIYTYNEAYSMERRARGGAVSIRNVEKAININNSFFGFSDNKNLTDCTDLLNGNYADGITRASGGALDLFNASANIKDCQFFSNKIKSEFPVNLPLPGQKTLNHIPDNMGYGGAVALHKGGEIKCKNTDFAFNESDVCAGAIGFVGKSESITGEGSAMLDYNSFQKIDLSECRFFENSSQIHGGAIAGASLGSSGIINKCRFIDNSTLENTIDADGGAISYQVTGAPYGRIIYNLKVNSTLFDGNYANDGGGAIKTGGTSKVFVNNCILMENESRGSGGAIRSSTLGNVVIKKSHFTKNSSGDYEDSFSESSGDGGAIATDNSYLETNNCLFKNNISGRSGGAIYSIIKQSGYELVDGLVILRFSSVSSNLNDSIFEENNAELGGGACAVKMLPQRNKEDLTGLVDARFNSNKCIFKNNYSIFSVPLYNQIRKPNLSLDINMDGIFAENFVNKQLNVNIKGSSFKSHGGAIFTLNWLQNSNNTMTSVSKDTKFEDCNIAITSRHADLNIDSASFTYSSNDQNAIDVLILDTPNATLAPSGKDIWLPSLPNNQHVKIYSSLFDANKKATGVLVVRDEYSASDLNIKLRENNFAGRQLVPAPDNPPNRAKNGAVVVWDHATSSVDAVLNYWDHPDGPFAIGNINKLGSYASLYVTYETNDDTWLKKP